MESLNSSSQERERVASVATNTTQSKGKLHEIFSTTSITSPGSMLLHLDQLEKQLGKEEFQETGSMDAFKALKRQFQLLISFQYNFEGFDELMIRKYSLAYTRTETASSKTIKETNLDSATRYVHGIKYKMSKAKKRCMTHEGKVDSGEALDVSLVDTECSETKSEKYVTSSRSGNDTHAANANKEPMAKSLLISFPKVRESASAKPHYVNAPNSSRNSKKELYGSNDMAHNHYLEEARKKTQERNRNSSFFLNSKHFVCSTCQNCIFNVNNDDCINNFLKEMNSRAKVQSPKTRNNNKPIEPKSHTQKPGRQITIGQMFSLNKSSTMHEKPHTPRSCLRWKPTGRIFKTVGLRRIPTGKMFTDSTTKVNSEPPNSLNDDITNPYECDQTLYFSACTFNSSACTSVNPIMERLRVWLPKRLISHTPGV
nr:hypothetical protein [Tanacetum cinerariifolium]